MEKMFLLSTAKRVQIALAVVAACGMGFVGADKAYAEGSMESGVTAVKHVDSIALGNITTKECSLSLVDGLKDKAKDKAKEKAKKEVKKQAKKAEKKYLPW